MISLGNGCCKRTINSALKKQRRLRDPLLWRRNSSYVDKSAASDLRTVPPVLSAVNCVYLLYIICKSHNSTNFRLVDYNKDSVFVGVRFLQLFNPFQHSFLAKVVCHVLFLKRTLV